MNQSGLTRLCLALAVASSAVAVRPASLGGQEASAIASRAARQSPAWVHDGVIYELNTRTFSAAGTFNAVTARLPELRRLGVSIVWLMPIHPLGQVKKKGTIGSPYAVRDYYMVNPDYGTEADFRRLVRAAHDIGLKVIIDVVANHTAWDNPLIETPAFYQRDAAGRVLSPFDWSDVAALDYGNPKVRDYMGRMLQHWVREFDVDGFRCDVAGMVPLDFWEDVRRDLERIKPEIVLLAEAHEPALVAEAFDLDYSWPLYHAMKEAIIGNGPATAIREEWEAERRSYPRGALHLRIADNHDEKRAIALFGERGALAASALVFTMDGVPLLYNGMEVGDVTESTAPALFERLPIFWDIRERRPEFPRFYDRMIGLRKAHAALRQGATTWLRNADERRIVTYLRHDASEAILVAVNLSNQPFVGTVELAGAGFVELAAGGDSPAATAALPAISLEPWGFRLFRQAR
jgi:glycosidase